MILAPDKLIEVRPGELRPLAECSEADLEAAIDLLVSQIKANDR